jgi:drug/metabolite transporter (DMT)-like permease
MPILAIAMLFGSAFLHTWWNLLLKQAGEKYIATWWATLFGSLIFLPFLFITGLPNRGIWYLLLISALVEVAYYIVLSTAYRDADFSLVYPLARGAAPALIAIWSILFLGEKLTLGGGLGLGLIILGLFVVGGGNLFQGQRETPHLRGVLLALLLAVLISIYSTIDGYAVRQTPAISYAVFIFLLPPLLTAPFVYHRYGWQVLKFDLAKYRIRIVSIGLLAVSAYMIVLAAFSIAPVSYSGAIREVSVVIGAVAGWRFLGERLGGWRLGGSIIIFCGILVIAFFG